MKLHKKSYTKNRIILILKRELSNVHVFVIGLEFPL